MIHTGQHQNLVILRNTSVGLFLGDGEGGDFPASRGISDLDQKDTAWTLALENGK